MEKVIIIGGGSFTGNLINYIESMGIYSIVGYTDVEDHGHILGIPYLGDDSILIKHFNCGIRNACIGIGNNLNNTTLKREVTNKAKLIGFNFPIITGRNVIIHRGASIGEGTIIRDSAIIQSNCKLGNFCIIGDNVVISHDTAIGDFTQIVTGCIVGKDNKIGENVFMGFSSVLSNNLIISDSCVIGAKSFVNSNCIKKGLYIGQPAKIIKEYE
jgi:sugar O-acyltransferase (sialic acid O-acetyltransferase NeuD family)